MIVDIDNKPFYRLC